MKITSTKGPLMELQKAGCIRLTKLTFTILKGARRASPTAPPVPLSLHPNLFAKHYNHVDCLMFFRTPLRSLELLNTAK